MAVKNDKKRIMITLDLETLSLIEDASKKNMRTISNELALLIKKEYGSKEK